ncbi:excisionase family DNA-binding protein [Curtobacterium sp. MCPF17_002]|uniref:excisionase family DNA-binding protein n=1 Tax=Curtobacterium sp. MCPF17_002 TaxID=2175645 RepID=UPI000DAA187D|nr:excisionase family DNA-binding protein [Curtobacterium sp. MCPF17_002]WIB76894.1 excisionase family DNA-binding protein [Curtobacterium sp. MCPF17_002]
MRPTTTMQDVRVDEVARAEANELLDRAGDRQVDSIAVRFDDGSTVELPRRLARFVSEVLESMAAGAGVATSVLPSEMTTTVAADVIGISRPTLMKMIQNDEISAHRVGTHHRLRRADVLSARTARAERRAAAASELLRAGEAFD